MRTDKPTPPDRRTNNRRALEAFAVSSQLALLLGACVLIGLLGGAFIDGKLDTSPLFLIIGSVVGMVAGIYSVARTARFVLDVMNRDRDRKGS